MMEQVLHQFVVEYVVLGVVGAALFLWARRLPRRRVPAWHRTALRVVPPVILAILAGVGLIGGIGLHGAYGAVTAAPSEKATLLARGISLAANAWAVAAACLLATATYLAFVRWRARG